MEYQYFFESDYGMESGFVVALNRHALVSEMKKQFPDDSVSDGFVVYPDVAEYPLNW